MNNQTHTINIGSRAYQAQLPLSQDLNFADQNNYCIDLHYLGLIQVKGEGAADFLQGQLTCDVREVNATSMKQGAQCNLKGRVLSLPGVILANGVYWLILPQDLIPQTIASLEKTALLSRVQLIPHMPVTAIGLILNHPLQTLDDELIPKTIHAVVQTKDCLTYRINEQSIILLNTSSDPAGFNKIHHQLQQQCIQKSELAWHYYQLKNKHTFNIYPETRGLFLPHRLNLHTSDHISFNKGCYKGQEIIARTHYRATQKHQLNMMTLQLDSLPLLGEELIAPKTQHSLGELVDYCPLNTPNHFLVAIIQQMLANNLD